MLQTISLSLAALQQTPSSQESKTVNIEHSGQARTPGNLFQSGIYKFQGAYKNMYRKVGEELTGGFSDQLGVDASNPAQPQFMFIKKEKGEWLVHTKALVRTSDDMKVLTYSLSEIWDIGASAAESRIYDVAPMENAELVVDMSDYPRTSFRFKKGNNWSGSFSCTGNLVFSPKAPAKQ